MANPIWNGANAKWSVAADWSTGLPQPGDDVSIPSGTVLLDSTTGSTSVASITVAATLNIKDPGATVTVTGGLTDSGSVTVDSGAFDPGGTTLAVGGSLTVSGGSLAVGNYLQGANGGGGGTATLTTVTANSLTNTGIITIQSDQGLGSRAVLHVASAAGFGGQTGVLTGNVDIGSDGTHAGGDGLLEFASGQITTIASQASLSLYGTGSFIADAGSTTSNSALTGLANVNGSLTLQAGVVVSPTGALTIGSNGTVAVDNAFLGTAGSKLAVGGVSGAMLTVGGSLSIGRSAMTGNATVTAGSLSNPGTISLNGADASDMGLLEIAGSAGFGTANTLTGNVSLQGFSLLQFASDQITTIAQNASLQFNGANAFIADTGSTTTNSALTGLTTINGTLDMQTGVVIAPSGAVTIGSNGHVAIDTGFLANAGSKFEVTGSLTVNGSLSVGRSAMTGNAEVTAASLSGTGTISLVGADASDMGELIVAGAAGFGGTGAVTGSLSLQNYSVLQFASGQITSVAFGGGVSIDGTQAFIADGSTTSNSALTGLTTVGGNLSLFDGASISTSGGLTLGDGTHGASIDVTNGASLTINGTLNINDSEESLSIGGRFDTVSTKVTTSAVTFVGTGNSGITIGGGSAETLSVASAAGFGTVGVLSGGSVSLGSNSLLQFASGQITSIAFGASLSIDGTNAFLADAGSTTSNSALTGLTTVAGGLSLLDGASVTTSGGVTIGDGTHGAGISLTNGASLTINGTLNINDLLDSLSIGGRFDTASTKVTASAVTFVGTGNSGISIGGGSAETFSVASAAGFGTVGVLAGGSVSLGSNSLLQFASGQITSIAFGGSLSIDGPNAFLADTGSTTSNSALTGLATVGGSLSLHDGASIATSAGFTIGDGTHGTNVTVDSGASLAVNGTLTIDNNCGLTVGAAPTMVTVNGLSNSGTINIQGGILKIAGALSGNGAQNLAAGATLELGSTASGGTITFASGNSTLRLDSTTMPTDTISGFAPLDTIDLAAVGFTTSGSAQMQSGNVLQIVQNANTYHLQFDQSFSGEFFQLLPDGAGGTEAAVGQLATVSSGQTVSNTPVTTSNFQDVYGTASGTTVSSGAVQVVYSGGKTSGTIVDGGGRQYVFSGGTASETSLSGGTEYVYSGTVSGTTVSSGGTLELFGGAIASATTVSTGGTLEAGSGYSVSGYFVSSGATLAIASGGSAVGATVSSGGTLTVSSGGTLTGNIVNNGAVIYDTSGTTTFSGTLAGSGLLAVSGGGHLSVASAYTGAAQVDDNSTLEFASTYVGALSFSASSIGAAGTVKFDAGSTGPITVVNSNDDVIAQPGSGDWINAAVSYTLPTNIDTLFLFAGAQGTGNSDASGDALYALDTGNTQTLTGNTANDAFVVYNSSDVVVPKAGSHDVVYAAASYTLPTGIDTLFLEGTAARGTGNSDAAGDALYAANPGQVATLTGNSANDAFVVYNSADVVVPKAGSHDSVYSAVNYTLPTGVDVLFLEAGTKGAGNSDASGDALYAADAGIAQTLTGNSGNDSFVVYNSADVVAPKAGSHDMVYSAVNYTLPTGVDTLILEAGTQGVGNSDAAGDTLYAANGGIAQTLTGHSHNDSFVVYNAGDTVIGQAGSTDTVYAAANFTLPTNVDTLLLEGNASHGTGNSDASNALYGNGSIASTLAAGSGADTLHVTGTAGTILTGGTGHDTFAFPNVMGHDEITNFGTSKDTLQFNATLFANFTAAMNHASQSGANTVFTIDTNDTVTLDNVTKTSLTASNFHFT